MSNNDEFWNLTGSDIQSQKDLLKLLFLDKTSHLRHRLYKPDKLQAQEIDDPRQRTIRNITFTRVSFSKTHISGFTFRDCTFDRCLFVGSIIDGCEFHNCTFRYTNTHKITISNTYIDPKSFDHCLSKKVHQNIGVHLYQMLLKNSHHAGQTEFVRKAQFLFLRWKRFLDGYEIKNWEDRKKEKPPSRKYIQKCLKYFRRFIWEKLFGSGLHLGYFSATVSVIFSFCVFLNISFGELFGLGLPSDPASSCVAAIYFTAISFTTLGYGDIVPTTSIGQIWASFQSLLGFFLFALSASMVFRRIST